MNPLQTIHTFLDESEWDAVTNNINKKFQEVNEEIKLLNDDGLLRMSEVERWTFAFNKSPDSGITCMMSGTKKIENGEEMPYEWPDKNELTDDDFTYIKDRFENCKNLFAKVEYGLLLYYCKKLKTNDEVYVLINDLYNLVIQYQKHVKNPEDKNLYTHFFSSNLRHALFIAQSRKNSLNIVLLYETIIKYASEVYVSWDFSNSKTLGFIINLTNIINEFIKDFNRLTSLKKVLDLNFKAANSISKSNNWGSIDICNVSQKIADFLKDNTYDWLTLKAEQYEAMIQDAMDKGNLAAVSFVEDAIRLYRQVGNKEKVGELEKKYNELRRAFKMGSVVQELPQEEMKKILHKIEEEVKNNSPEELVILLARSPMFASLEQVKRMSEEIAKQNFISNLLPCSIIDKFGNTVDIFITDEEKESYRFWQTYEHNFQIGSQILGKFFIDTIRAKKINYDVIEVFLSSTWISGRYNVIYNGKSIEICPFDNIRPGLKLYFQNLECILFDSSYTPNYICATDSLVTKCEYLLRFFCELAGITTFIDKQKGSHKLKMEKNIDELLFSLKDTPDNLTGFSEEDRLFIQFVLSQKVGLNLRHRVAHGLLDPNEYGFMNPLYILLIILKLSQYRIRLKEQNS